MEIKIHPSVTPEQQRDPRFQQLLREAEYFFNSPEYEHYKLLLGLHEAGHTIYAKRAGATNIRRHGPRMIWDSRPQYNCPAISKSSVGWTRNGGSNLDNLKTSVAGYVVRRELSGAPNDELAIETDLDIFRDEFDSNNEFNVAVANAESEILKDLRSPAIRHEIWDEARRFVKEVFQPTEPTPTVKTGFVKIGRNEPCPCGSGKKYRKCHLAIAA